MAKYYFIKNYNNYGKLAINRDVFKYIAAEAVSNISGASVSSKKGSIGKKFNIGKDDIEVTYHSNGQVELTISVALAKNANIEKTCRLIQEEVSNAIYQYTESVPLTVTINISSIN